MHSVQKISENIYWVGGNDRRLERFENMFPIPNGVCYNSFLILDEKTALMDTVDTAISRLFIENITHVLNGRDLDYLVINHMEPDHCANIEELVKRYPNIKIVGNKKTFQFIGQFYDFDYSMNMLEVKDGETLCLGRHNLKFMTVPMVHWPEVMFTYEETEKILFSADAFGTFGALAGNIFCDETDYDHYYLEEARRYYSNIVGKYGQQVQSALKKLKDYEVNMICSLHGPIWRENLPYILNKYDKWSKYEPEKNGVVLVYASMYGNIENTINVIANKLAQKGVKDMRVYDISKTHPSYIISDIWKYSHVIFGSVTYNMGLYYGMESLLNEIKALNMQNRKVGLVGSGTWSPQSVKIMQEIIGSMKNMDIVGEPFEVTSSMKQEQEEVVDKFVEDFFKSIN
ncbi:MAG: FprA family A-type flavoprotein [Sedimentibacter sp.]|jgi:flavorubredoxin|nr:FprA family A-type flavoprotein [Sedimentibacter sp.]